MEPKQRTDKEIIGTTLAEVTDTKREIKNKMNKSFKDPFYHQRRPSVNRANKWRFNRPFLLFVFLLTLIIWNLIFCKLFFSLNYWKFDEKYITRNILQVSKMTMFFDEWALI